jgi:hypothetical protein
LLCKGEKLPFHFAAFGLYCTPVTLMFLYLPCSVQTFHLYFILL